MSTVDTDTRAAELVSAALSAMLEQDDARLLATMPEVKAIADAPDHIRRRCLVLAAGVEDWRALALAREIADQPITLGEEEAAALLPVLGRVMGWWEDEAVLLDLVRSTWQDLDGDGRARLRQPLLMSATETGSSLVAARLRRIAATGAAVPYDLIDDSSEVGKALRKALEASTETDQAKAALINLLADYPPIKGKPGRAWQRDSQAVFDALRDPAAITAALLDAAIEAPDFRPRWASVDIELFATIANDAFLCGVTVLASRAAAPALLPRLRRLALKAIVIIGGQWGKPRSARLANHCVQAIIDTSLPGAITELLSIERGTRHGSLIRQTRKAIDELAARQALTRDDLLELAVEDHGLGPGGTRRIALAEGWTAIIEAGPRTAHARYETPDGTARKSLPAAVKAGDVRSELKSLRATIGNERARLDSLLVLDRSWQVGRWRSLYLDHPVTGQLTRAMIWRFGPELAGIPVDHSTMLTADGGKGQIPEDAEVRLWHPVHANAAEVASWRRLLLDRELVQPVKQAFREVYRLTPAEEQTGDYSNRFAGHIFRQEPARALLKGRSWSPVPLAAWDDGIDHGVARREYARQGGAGPAVRAEFFFDPADDYELAGSGMFAYCTSDQVRFFDAGSVDAVPLAVVPDLVFSEAMRDLDLVISMSSVGADPLWLDRGDGRFADYWHQYAFGDLHAGAEVRRDVLAALIPMLAIADRCELDGRYLRVRGDLRSYRIHLGSGNILMAPNDQYLCIVPGASDARTGKLFLPFDDDPVLSLILSKAFMLAADTKITDPSITRQIGAR